MGFPRVLSKNNKIYTKLGEFCLSGDGVFWIVCHTCQEEMSQEIFWKHIQDEHNFGLKQGSASNVAYMEAEMALPLYRKMNEEEQRMLHAQQVAAAAAAAEEDEENNMQDEEEDMHSKNEPLDYKDMRAMETGTNTTSSEGGGGGGGNGGGSVGGGVEVDIKMEATSMSQNSSQPQELPIASTIYQLTPQSAGYASIMQHHSNSALNMLSATAGVPLSATHLLNTASAHQTQHLLQQQHQQQQQHSHKQEATGKDNNSNTTASASSAISSDDGERWYVCDHETCGLKFKYQSRLELHRSVHSKERRFACELCGASFKQSCNLSTHRKKKHFLKGSKGLVPPSQPQQQPTQQMQHQIPSQLQQQVVQQHQQATGQQQAHLQTLPPQRF